MRLIIQNMSYCHSCKLRRPMLGKGCNYDIYCMKNDPMAYKVEDDLALV